MPYEQNDMRISLGPIPLMEAGQPLDFDAAAASAYLKEMAAGHGTVEIAVSIGEDHHSHRAKLQICAPS